jgi:hypothetical protein
MIGMAFEQDIDKSYKILQNPALLRLQLVISVSRQQRQRWWKL